MRGHLTHLAAGNGCSISRGQTEGLGGLAGRARRPPEGAAFAACAGQAVGSGDDWMSRAECASAGAFFGVLATGAVAGAAAHGAGPLERAVSR